MSFVRKIGIGEVEIEASPEEELEPPEDAFDDPELAASIRSRMGESPGWAWCTAVVRATWKSFSGEATLGCCAYDSEEDFRSNSGYWETMVGEALADLQISVDRVAKELEPLVTQESFDAWTVERVQED